MKKHRWPIRRFTEPRDRIGMTTEPVGHNEQGEPLYTVYESDTCQTRMLTEAETIDLFRDLANPNRWLYE